MAKGYQLAILIFLITANMASIALGSKTSPYSIDFDLRNMDGFNDNVISAGDIEAFIKDRYAGSPMLVESDIGNCFINAGQENNVNPAFLVATACLEGGFGTLGWAQSHPECHNTFGYGIPSGTTQPDDYNCMDSWCVMIERVASVIAHGNNYYTKGLYTVSQVRGKYAASPNSDSIASLMNKLYAFSNIETATSNTVVEEPSSGIDQSQASNSLGLPLQVLSPVIGSLEVVSDLKGCSGTKWCFNQHKTGNGGIGHIPGGGVGRADDTYAWDANLNTPQSDSDNGKAVYAIAPGVVCQTYGGKKNADDIGSYGQVLIEHSNQGTKWWSGYLHLANIQVKKGQAVSEDTILGDISQVGANNNHLHFAVYTGENSEGKLKSIDTQITPRSGSLSVEGDTQETSIKPPNILTLYVHDGSANGPIIPDATVTGQDASGNSFQQITNSEGYVTITGYSGTWSFSVSAEGYDINSWSQSITNTCTKHAFLQKDGTKQEPEANAGSDTDSILPTVQNFQVAPQSVTTDESITIDYTVSDTGGSGLNRVELWRKDEQSDWQEIKRDALSGGDGPATGSFTDASSNAGKYWYGIHVADNAGNWNDERNSNSNNQPGGYSPVEVEIKRILQPEQKLIDNYTEITIPSRTSLKLEEGYELAIKSVDMISNKAYVELSKDGQLVDSKVVSVSKDGTTANDTYYYKKDIGNRKKVTIIAVHFRDFFQKDGHNSVTIDRVMQISDE